MHWQFGEMEFGEMKRNSCLVSPIAVWDSKARVGKGLICLFFTKYQTIVLKPRTIDDIEVTSNLCPIDLYKNWNKNDLLKLNEK